MYIQQNAACPSYKIIISEKADFSNQEKVLIKTIRLQGLNPLRNPLKHSIL